MRAPSNKRLELTAPLGAALGDGEVVRWRLVLAIRRAPAPQLKRGVIPTPARSVTELHEGLYVAKQAWELYEQGRLEESAERYSDAARILPEGHYYKPDVHRERAMVLVRLGRNEEALAEYELGLAYEKRQNPDESEAPMVVARYFLGEHFLRLGRAQEALQTVLPSIGVGARREALARLVQAEALGTLGRLPEAKAAANEAIRLSSEKQRPRFEERLQALLHGAG
jgi:tetratricopeptide (TPR) repeat protein